MKTNNIEIYLAYLTRTFQVVAPQLEKEEVEMELVRAQLADLYRDAATKPVDAIEFGEITEKLDQEGWRRLALTVSGLKCIPEEFAQLVKTHGAKKQFDKLVSCAQKTTKVLNMKLLRQSRLRTEEFARHLILDLGAKVGGETSKESMARLKRIDYSRLLLEAKNAKASAEDRLAHLKKLQEEQERRLAPRGKW